MIYSSPVWFLVPYNSMCQDYEVKLFDPFFCVLLWLKILERMYDFTIGEFLLRLKNLSHFISLT